MTAQTRRMTSEGPVVVRERSFLQTLLGSTARFGAPVRVSLLIATAVASIAASIGAIFIPLMVAGQIAQALLDRGSIWQERPLVAVLAAAVLTATGVWLTVRFLKPPVDPEPPDSAVPDTELPHDDTVAADGRVTWTRWTAAEIVLYLGAALLMFWPATLRLDEVIVGAGDARYYMWQSWSIGELMRSGDIFSLRLTGVTHPYGVDLRLTDGLLPSLWSGVLNLGFRPFFAYNLTLLSAVLLNMWAGRRLAREITRVRAIAIICALAFATAPVIAVRLGVHMALSFTFPAALLVAEAIRVASGRHEVRVVRTVLLFALAFLCSVYYLVFGAIAFAVIVAGGHVDLQRARRAGFSIIAAALAAAILLAPLLLPRFDLAADERAAGAPRSLVDQAIHFTPPALSILRPVRADAQALHETLMFQGALLLLGVAALVLLGSRLHRSLRAAAIVLWVLSLGPSLNLGARGNLPLLEGEPLAWLPYTLLMQVPGLGVLRTPGRATLTLAAVLTAALALGLAWAWGRTSPRGRAVLISVASALLATNLLIPIHTSDAGLTEMTREVFSQIAGEAEPEDAVLSVPSDCRPAGHPDVVFQLFHERPMVGCQAALSALPFFTGFEREKNSEALAALRCTPAEFGRVGTSFSGPELQPEHLDELGTDFDIRYLIVNKAKLRRFGCLTILNNLGVLGTRNVLGENDRWLIVDIS